MQNRQVGWLTAAVAGLVATSVQAAVWDGGGGNANWSTADNWVAPPVFGAGTTADLAQFNLAAATNSTVDTSTTVGELLIGDTDTTHRWTLNNSGGATLTFNNSGAGASITQSSTSLGDTISVPLVLADNLTINNNATLGASSAGRLLVSGAISGSGNLLVNSSGSGSGSSYQFNSAINNAGTLEFGGTGPGAIRIQGGIGTNVSQITQSGTLAGITVASQITVNASGTTIRKAAAGGFLAEQGAVGTGNLTLDNDSSGDIDFRGAGNTGKVFNTGSGTGTAQINGVVGANVTEVDQQSATSAFTIRGGSGTALSVGAGGKTLIKSGAALFYVKSGSAGTGDLTFKNNTTTSGGITNQSDGITFNHTGRIINSGTGTGSVTFSNGTVNIGSNVTGIVQNSPTSTLNLRGSGSTYAGNTEILAGTLNLFDNGRFRFVIGASGVNNAVTGSGTFQIDGDFVFDLTNAAPLGSWNIINVATLAETFGSTFTVVGFTETFANSGIWTLGDYTFTESTGALVAVPEPGSLSLLGLAAFALRRRRGA